MSDASFLGTPDDLRQSSLFRNYWYYAIELLPGLVTPGLKHLNLGLTRKLFAKCDVANRSVLDIGTMEAAIPILASRRGAMRVVGIDVLDLSETVAAVKHYTGAQFDYYHGLTHANTAAFLRQNGYPNFDIVVLSGVLYHCFGPLHTLAMARSLVRTGGLMVVETWAIIDEEYGMFFNAAGRFAPHDPSSYFLITLPLLDYVLRYFKLRPIDCIHGLGGPIGGHETRRVAIVCRAVDEIVGGDDWMQQATRMVDYLTLIDWENVEKTEASLVGYEGATDIVDLFRVAHETPQTLVAAADAVIALDDVK